MSGPGDQHTAPEQAGPCPTSSRDRVKPRKEKIWIFFPLQLTSLAFVPASWNLLFGLWAGRRWGHREGLSLWGFYTQIVISEPQHSCKIWVGNLGVFFNGYSCCFASVDAFQPAAPETIRMQKCRQELILGP